MSEKEPEEGENVIIIEIGLKQIIYVSSMIIVIVLAVLFLLNYIKPRLNLNVKFFPNNTVVISGRLVEGFNPVPYEYVAIEMRDQNDNTVWIDAVKTSDDGYFESVFLLNAEAEGKFDVYANTEIISERTSFQVDR